MRRLSYFILPIFAVVLLAALMHRHWLTSPWGLAFLFPTNAVASDMKPGSILVYNVFTSSVGSPEQC